MRAFALALIILLLVTGCGRRGMGNVGITTAVSDSDGIARIGSEGGVVDFQVSSGLTGERIPGIRIRVADWGDTRLVFAEDPTGIHLPTAMPLLGDSTLRRLLMPPLTDLGHNVTTASGALTLDDYPSLGLMTEQQLRDYLNRGPDEAVLIYLYNPTNPLALTGADLEVFQTPFDNVLLLRAPGETSEEAPGMVLVPLSHTRYTTWEHREVDRYLATRIGQQPNTDLNGDLAFNWSYPVFEVFPNDEVLSLDENGQVAITIRWRSLNPNPPPPWGIFLSSDREDGITFEPESALMGPDTASQEFVITVDRTTMPVGEQSLPLYIQPYSETFGLIEQSVTRTISFEVAEAGPTPTSGPTLASLTIDPVDPKEGDTLYIEATGFTPRDAVLVELIGLEYDFRDALPTATSEGAFNYLLDLKPVPAGAYTLRLTGTASQLSGELEFVVGNREADAVVANPELNLRTDPFDDATVLEVLVQGDELTVVAVNWDDSWLEVISPSGQQGWVKTALVDVNIDLTTVPWNSAYPNPNQ